jgi:lysine-N-methylase
MHPAYADRFRCIGPACEDICCQGWTVPVDQASWEKYQHLPPSPLRSLIDTSILRTAPNEDAPKHEQKPPFATIRMDSANQCPLLTADRLCAIQAEFGEEMLSHTCRTYPRIVHELGGVREESLALSCPEAARLVLLSPDLLSPNPLTSSHPGEQPVPVELAAPAELIAPNSLTQPAQTPLPPNFAPIRDTILALVRDRSYPLWQRLFLLSILCQRLDAIARGELTRPVPEFLEDFHATAATAALHPAMDSLPGDPKAQLDIVLRLAGLMLHKSNIRPRFVECIQAFTTGIGNGPGSTLESLTAHYNFAHDRYFQPFFQRHPHILENYLVNTILRCQFPFGKEGMRPAALPEMSREFALLTAQLTLVKGLLIGVAGFHRDSFAEAHVVHTVQAAAKHFEHHPEFLSMAHALLVESHMDDARGIAVLLRNGTEQTPSSGPAPASPSVETPARQP